MFGAVAVAVAVVAGVTVVAPPGLESAAGVEEEDAEGPAAAAEVAVADDEACLLAACCPCALVLETTGRTRPLWSRRVTPLGVVTVMRPLSVGSKEQSMR